MIFSCCSFLQDVQYRSLMINSANYNVRLMRERKTRLPFLDSQTGVCLLKQTHADRYFTGMHVPSKCNTEITLQKDNFIAIAFVQRLRVQLDVSVLVHYAKIIMTSVFLHFSCFWLAGIAQNPCKLYMSARHRMPGTTEGQLYVYPSQRWCCRKRSYMALAHQVC